MNARQPVKLRYDGKYDFLEGDARCWTVRSHTVVNGRDLYNCSMTGAMGLLGLLGIPTNNKEKP